MLGGAKPTDVSWSGKTRQAGAHRNIGRGSCRVRPEAKPRDGPSQQVTVYYPDTKQRDGGAF